MVNPAGRQPYDGGSPATNFPAGHSAIAGTDTPAIGRIVQVECSNPSTSCRSIDRAMEQHHWPMTSACYCSSSTLGARRKVVWDLALL